MRLLRALLAVSLGLALAACAATESAPQKRTLRTGGPQPPVPAENACKVDADCNALQRCEGVACRCVDTRCIAPKEAIDPVIDPAPTTSVR